MKILAVGLIFFTQLDAHSASARTDSEVIDRLRNQCGFAIPENIFSETFKGNMEIAEHSGFVLQLNLRGNILGEKARESYLSFYCWEDGVKSRVAKLKRNIVQDRDTGLPRKIGKNSAVWAIDQMEAGGRYFSNIAWSRQFEAEGWHGSLAYVNYVYGDLTKIPENYILICDDEFHRPCFRWTFDKSLKPNRRIFALVLSTVRHFSHF